MPGGNCVFNPLWLSKPEYAGWLRDQKGDKHVGFCHVCKTKINVKVMGESAIVSHARGKNHKELVKASEPAVPLTKLMSTSKESTSDQASPIISVNQSSVSMATVSGFCTKSEVPKAEIVHSQAQGKSTRRLFTQSNALRSKSKE